MHIHAALKGIVRRILLTSLEFETGKVRRKSGTFQGRRKARKTRLGICFGCVRNFSDILLDLFAACFQMSKISKIAWEEDETGGWKKTDKDVGEFIGQIILLETNISPRKVNFEDDFPNFPRWDINVSSL